MKGQYFEQRATKGNPYMKRWGIVQFQFADSKIKYVTFQ